MELDDWTITNSNSILTIVKKDNSRICLIFYYSDIYLNPRRYKLTLSDNDGCVSGIFPTKKLDDFCKKHNIDFSIASGFNKSVEYKCDPITGEMINPKIIK